MTKEWVEMMNKKAAERFKDYPKVIVDYWNDTDKCIKDKTPLETEMAYLALCVKYNEPFDKILFLKLHMTCDIRIRFIVDEDLELLNFYTTMNEMCENYYNFLCGKDSYYLYEDSEEMFFDGDIIITDPCYITHDEFLAGISHSTIYGDWSCHTYDLNTEKPIGQFCADGGEVCVISLAEALEIKPTFNYHIERPWTTTLIKDFCGTAQIKVKEENGDYLCYVEGHGYNKITGEAIDFITEQTGL